MKVQLRETVIHLDSTDRIGTVTDWRGHPFSPTRLKVSVWENRSRVEVKGRGFSAMFKIRGDTRYRDCPTWIIALLVDVRVEF